MPYNLSRAVFTQRNFVADLLQAKYDFTRKTAVWRFYWKVRSKLPINNNNNNNNHDNVYGAVIMT